MKLSTREYPCSEADIRLEYPEIREDQTGGTFSCPVTYVPVKEGPKPPFDYLKERLELQPPHQRPDGLWQANWLVVSLDQDKIDQRKRLAEAWAKANSQ